MAPGISTVTVPDAVVLDVGGVLVDWDPRHLYRRIFSDPAEMERFLADVCTPEWHLQHDRGIPYEETIPALVAAHPDRAAEIRAWGDRFDEMYGGAIRGTVDLLAALRDRDVPSYASTNWGAESWARAKLAFPFLDWFDGALVSGEVGISKPDPAFYALLVERFALDPSRTFYVEDNEENLRAAGAAGFVTHHFVDPPDLAAALRDHGLLPPAGDGTTCGRP
ncbi:MAG TPA: HAD family phosphatase [Acidimicrobiales bacterium]|nr:HAD family phosphatase [Acidimicrobiales bacterium]